MPTLHHPDLDAPIEVTEITARVLKRSGWTEKAPRPKRTPRKKKTQAEAEAEYFIYGNGLDKDKEEA